MADTPRPAVAEPPAPRFTLRQLPLPAKLVISVFLLAVGLGYTSAMLQLHMQHSERDGNTLPTPENVISVFAGKRWAASPADYTRAIGRLELLILGEPGGPVTATNMAPAFFAGDGGGKAGYATQAKDPARKPKLDEEREGERKALLAWINAPADERKAAYEADAFTLPGDPAKQVVTPEFVAGRTGVVKIKSIIDSRCARCHGPDGAQSNYPLTSYAQVGKPAYIPENEVVPEGGGWVNSGRKMSLEKLTQSTHAHLLSFAMLYALTGLVFAFTGLPTVVRAILAPLALVAQVADIACWWLAWRLDPPYGPYCAMAIIGTGGVVGLALAAHIVLSLFSMYGPKGKAVLLVLLAAGAGGGAALWKAEIDPALRRQKDEAAAKAAEVKKQAADLKAAAGKKDVPPAQEKKSDPVPPKKNPERRRPARPGSSGCCPDRGRGPRGRKTARCPRAAWSARSSTKRPISRPR